MNESVAKDSYWFRHDSTAGRGLKFRKLQHIYGHEGKGIYWDVIEILREQEKYEYECDSSSLQMLCDIIGHKDVTRFMNWFNECVRLELLVKTDTKFFSPALTESMVFWEKQRKNGKQGGRNPDVSQIEAKTNPNGNPELTMRLQDRDEIINTVLELLNREGDLGFKVNTESNRKHLIARIKEGFVAADFEAVVRHKCQQWKNNDMRKYLRPSTLFNSEKFDGYLQESKKSKPLTVVKKDGTDWND